MIDSRLKLAVERLRRITIGELVEDVYKTNPSEYRMDQGVIVKAYLAEHPADDDEPVTAEWLVCVSQKHIKLEFFVIGKTEELNVYVCASCDATSFYADIVQDCDSVSIPLRTRGDLRRLCKGLKIALKEPS